MRGSPGRSSRSIAIIAAVAAMVACLELARRCSAAGSSGRRRRSPARLKYADDDQRMISLAWPMAGSAAREERRRCNEAKAAHRTLRTPDARNRQSSPRSAPEQATHVSPDPGSYDANRTLGALYLSQHRFREAVRAGEQNRAARPDDPINYGVIGDGLLELGEYQEAFDAFDQMMKRRPGSASSRRGYRAANCRKSGRRSMSMTLACSARRADRSGRHPLELPFSSISPAREDETAKAQYVAASHAFPGHPFAVIPAAAKARWPWGDHCGALSSARSRSRRARRRRSGGAHRRHIAEMGRADEAERQFALAEAGWRGDAPEPKNLARFLAEHDRKIPEAVTIAETPVPAA